LRFKRRATRRLRFSNALDELRPRVFAASRNSKNF